MSRGMFRIWIVFSVFYIIIQTVSNIDRLTATIASGDIYSDTSRGCNTPDGRCIDPFKAFGDPKTGKQPPSNPLVPYWPERFIAVFNIFFLPIFLLICARAFNWILKGFKDE